MFEERRLRGRAIAPVLDPSAARKVPRSLRVFRTDLPWPTSIVLAVGTAAIGVFYLLPAAGVAQCVVLCSVNLASAVVASVTAARVRRHAGRLWIGLAVGQWFALAANAPYYAYPLVTGTRLSFPTAVDALFLATYPSYVFALWALAKKRSGDDGRGEMLDALIVFLAGGSVMWTLALAPALHSSGLSVFGHVVAPMYPVMDLALFAVLARLLIGWGRNGAFRLILGSFMALQFSDLLYHTLLANGTFHIGGPNDGLWMLSYLLIAAAGLHPAARTLGQPTEATAQRISRGRPLFLAAALLVGPALLVTRHQDRLVLGCLTALTLLLVVLRMALLNRRLASARLALEQKAVELRHQALHDSLTGLASRALLIERTEQMLARARRRRVPVTAMYVDIDDFKHVNDTLGHAGGDEVLKAVADRMRSVVREEDTVGRMGGDEFVILIDDDQDPPAEQIAERTLEALRRPINLVESATGRTVSITASAGIATGEQGNADDLLREADFALYEAKARGKNRHASFEPRMEREETDRLALQSDLARALQEEQLFLLYQPTVDLQRELITGVEALLRWRHPQRGLVTPDIFIPLAEANGTIASIDHWVLRTACVQAGEWHRQGRKLAMSVNISASQLNDAGLLAEVRDALVLSGLEAKWLTLEITETALVRDPDAAAETLHALKALGVRIAVDDFGTGYSSLSLLHQLPVDVLKIDRSFVENIAHSPQSQALLRTFVQLGETLGLETLGEGIEDREQLQRLQQAHCDLGQGFLFSQPVPAAAIEDLAPTSPERQGRQRMATHGSTFCRVPAAATS